MATRSRRARAPDRRVRRLRDRAHDMFEPTDFDFPDDHEIEDWMAAKVNDGEMGS